MICYQSNCENIDWWWPIICGYDDNDRNQYWCHLQDGWHHGCTATRLAWKVSPTPPSTTLSLSSPPILSTTSQQQFIMFTTFPGRETHHYPHRAPQMSRLDAGPSERLVDTGSGYQPGDHHHHHRHHRHRSLAVAASQVTIFLFTQLYRARVLAFGEILESFHWKSVVWQTSHTRLLYVKN